MTNFFGGVGNETITPGFVSSSVGRFNGAGLPSTASDSLNGGGGADTLDGGGGNDTIAGGLGDDSISTHANDFNTVVDGGAGRDTLSFASNATGAAATSVDTSGGAVVITSGPSSTVHTSTITAVNVEALNIKTGGGSDIVTVHNSVGGTGLNQVNVDLGNDGIFDQVTLAASPTLDTNMSYSRDRATVSESSAEGGIVVNVTHFDSRDAVVLNGGAGNDQLTDNFSANLNLAVPHLILNGGDGADTLTGTSFDTLNGGAGNDRLTMNGPGAVNGDAGNDSFQINLGAIPFAHGVTTVSAGTGSDQITAQVGNPDNAVTIDFGADSDVDLARFTVTTTPHAAIFVRDQGRLEGGFVNTGTGRMNDNAPVFGKVTNAHAQDIVVLDGGASSETLEDFSTFDVGFAGSVRLEGFGGDDTLSGLDHDLLDGGSGADLLTLQDAGGGAVFGGPGRDTINVTFGRDISGAGIVVDGGTDFDVLRIRDQESSHDDVTSITTDDLSRLILRHVQQTVTGDPVIVTGTESITVTTDGSSGQDLQLGDVRGAGVVQLIVHYPGADTDGNTIHVSAGAGADTLGLHALNDVAVVTGLTAAGAGSAIRVDGMGAHQTVNLDGGAGNDQITVDVETSAIPAIVVHGGAGVDSITATAHFGQKTIFGDDGDDLISAGNAVIISGNGSDSLLDFGGDIFVFNRGETGTDALLGFHPHLGSGTGVSDLLEFIGTVDKTLSAAVANHHIFQQGADVVVTDGIYGFNGAHNVVAIANVNLASLSDLDFIFS